MVAPRELFQHHTADEPGRMREHAYEGVAAAAAKHDLHIISLSWPKGVHEWLGDYRVCDGQDISGRAVVSLVCRDGRNYDVFPTAEENAMSQDERGPHIMARLFTEVCEAFEVSKLPYADRKIREMFGG